MNDSDDHTSCLYAWGLIAPKALNACKQDPAFIATRVVNRAPFEKN